MLYLHCLAQSHFIRQQRSAFMFHPKAHSLSLEGEKPNEYGIWDIVRNHRLHRFVCQHLRRSSPKR